MENMLRILLICLWFIPFNTYAETEVWQAESGERQLALLELFTSEGCGLCPPADRWVQQLPAKQIDENNLIVLGFHIDYLDDEKGWIDRFAKAAFSDRQRQLARINLYQTIYTPEFVLSGEVIHSWRKHLIDVIHAVNKIIPDAKIKLSITHDDEVLTVNAKTLIMGDENKKFSQLYIAVTEDDVISKVSGGDNAGATFNHQNLVRQWIGPIFLDPEGESEISQEILIDPDWKLEQSSVIALVQNLEDGFVLQALKLPLSTSKN